MSGGYVHTSMYLRTSLLELMASVNPSRLKGIVGLKGCLWTETRRDVCSKFPCYRLQCSSCPGSSENSIKGGKGRSLPEDGSQELEFGPQTQSLEATPGMPARLSRSSLSQGWATVPLGTGITQLLLV